MIGTCLLAAGHIPARKKKRAGAAWELFGPRGFIKSPSTLRQRVGIGLPGIWLNDDAPFGKDFGSFQACSNGPEGRFAEPNTGLVSTLE